MLPVLLDLKTIRIYTFGAFLVLAWFWGSFLLWKNIRLSSYKEEDIFDGVFWAVSVGLLVGRIGHVALHFDKFGFDILKFILINGYPGISLYGFLFGGYSALWLYTRRKKMKFRDTTNYFISPTFLALSIGMIGNFFLKIQWTDLYQAVLFGIASFISYKILFAYRRQHYSQAFNFIFFCWSFSFISFTADLIARRQSIFPLVLLLTFSFYFLYYFRSPIFKKLSFNKSSHPKKHATEQKHHTGPQEKTD